MMKHFTRITKVLCCGSFLLGLLVSPDASAQISINSFTTSYSQNFDALPATSTGTWVSGTQYFPGWYLNRTIPTTTTLLYGTGSSNAGGLYSFGPAGSTDRALGAISSATATVGEFAWGLLIQNNTGSNITALNISFTGEQWRSSSSSAPQQATTFWYAINADAAAFNLSPKSDAGWTNVPELDFKSPVFKSAPGGLDGNASANRKFLSAVVPVTIPAGHYVMLRWKDLNDLYDDHGLAIDDFSMTWSIEQTKAPGILPVELISFAAKADHNKVKLSWATASEKDNKHFIIERSQNGKEFTSIAAVKSKGNNVTRTAYSFTDANPLAELSYYRLKQVDLDGSFTYSKLVEVNVQPHNNAILFPTIASENLNLVIPQSAGQSISIVDLAGREIYKQELVANDTQHLIAVNTLQAGIYSLLIFDKTGQRQVLRFIKR
ncbi:T9SS type A sorting domain-containing protein [Pontibacter sp. KCTC 32443]|uniref:T9SS type A sorting domain-containing protein n=1 Tax=Pontibacter TaxID=323449 RepID=UPI00164E89AF|nr:MULTISPECIES: T9SS type A sorting domain-containing protein [Pontibacter]MBC5775054.1 T9SS type A sorting domain-containing protein [Pontibacter sp. KCTC 32443]